PAQFRPVGETEYANSLGEDADRNERTKGICAAMIAAAVRLRDLGESRVGLLFVVGEETKA
ncbi:MAG: hypothetical protein ABL952_17780, partial [Pyrinomonadaceae bacterium]